MKLPEVRAELMRLAADPQTPAALQARLTWLAEETKRRKANDRGRTVSLPMTAELARRIRGYKRRHPKLTQWEVAQHFGVNQGRVSEAVRGKRH